MFTLSTTIPAAPYRVLEAIWYHNQLGTVSEHDFQYPYKKELSVNLEAGTTYKVVLKALTGTKLDFLISDEDGFHSALVSISAVAVAKNLTQAKLVMTQSSLNGTTEKVTKWLERVIDVVGCHYEMERKSA
ncbi:MAG: hypothetical protein LCH54_10790 [Bacteroidetes bacterium]|nr:hypothetical protein [Bacteroidota bacterium]